MNLVYDYQPVFWERPVFPKRKMKVYEQLTWKVEL